MSSIPKPAPGDQIPSPSILEGAPQLEGAARGSSSSGLLLCLCYAPGLISQGVLRPPHHPWPHTPKGSPL